MLSVRYILFIKYMVLCKLYHSVECIIIWSGNASHVPIIIMINDAEIGD